MDSQIVATFCISDCSRFIWVRWNGCNQKHNVATGLLSSTNDNSTTRPSHHAISHNLHWLRYLVTFNQHCCLRLEECIMALFLHIIYGKFATGRPRGYTRPVHVYTFCIHWIIQMPSMQISIGQRSFALAHCMSPICSTRQQLIAEHAQQEPENASLLDIVSEEW